MPDAAPDPTADLEPPAAQEPDAPAAAQEPDAPRDSVERDGSPGAPDGPAVVPPLLSGRTILVTGVLRPSSIASAVAAACRAQGARVILTGVPRTLRMTQAAARALGLTDPVLSLDVAATEGAAAPGRLLAQLRACGVERLDGLVHAVAHADPRLLGSVLESAPVAAGAGGSDLPRADGRDAALAGAFQVSVASLAGLVVGVRPLLAPRASVVALTFDSAHVHPGYGWMGPLKAALEASVRVLAVELGPSGTRVNAVSAGPLLTPAGSAIPRMPELAGRWSAAAPLGWDPRDAAPVAGAVVALLCDLTSATTGQVLLADGGASLRGV